MPLSTLERPPLRAGSLEADARAPPVASFFPVNMGTVTVLSSIEGTQGGLAHARSAYRTFFQPTHGQQEPPGVRQQGTKGTRLSDTGCPGYWKALLLHLIFVTTLCGACT